MKYDYDAFFEEKLRIIAGSSQRIIDVGGGRPFQKRLANHKELLSGKEYLTLDIDPNTHPDILGDAHNMTNIESGSVDAVLHIYVFEHLHSPHQAALAIHRILKPGGYMLGIVPFIHPYHAKKGAYRDYWRFCPDSLYEIFRDFKHVELFKVGRYFRAWVGFLPFLWRFRSILEPVAYCLDRLMDPHRNTTAGFIIFAKK